MKRTILASMAVMGLLWSAGCKKQCPPGDEARATAPAQDQPATPGAVPMLHKNISGKDYLSTVLRSRQMGQMINSMNRLRTIGVALHLYFNDRNQYPATLAELVQAGLVQEADLASPVDASRPYLYLPPKVAGSGMQIVAYESVSYGGKTPVLMADGAVINLEEKDLQEKLSAQK